MAMLFPSGNIFSHAMLMYFYLLILLIKLDSG